MARIEKDGNVQAELSQMKGEVISAVKKSKKNRAKQGCCSFLVVLFLVSVGSLIWMVASTGLIKIPVFSAWAYHKPEPTRIVLTEKSLETVIEEAIKTEVMNRIQTSGGVLTDRQISLNLPESALTASFRESLQDSDQNTIDYSQSQIAIINGQGLEIFMPFADSIQESAVVAQVALSPVDGLFTVDQIKVWIGQCKIPQLLSETLLRSMIDQGLNEVNQELGKFAKIDQIIYQDGSVELSGQITVNVLEL
ncbi:hypothetical protein ACFLZY_02815 [Patescibacteria group bacterium]